MATSAFKSTSRRGTSNVTSNSSSSKTPFVRKRSLSVSAVPRTASQLDIASEFSNKCDNPLFCIENDKQKGKDNENFASKNSLTDIVVEEERGRTVTRGSGVKNGIGRSVSRVRGRSVSRGHYGSSYESEKELESNTVQRLPWGKVVNRSKVSNLVRNGADKSSQAESLPVAARHSHVPEYSEDDSCSVHISNWEDGVSAASLSEAEEKTIKAVCEQMTAVQSDQSATSGIYETVRSEVRRAISDIQTDLESAMWRNNVSDIPTADVADNLPNLVNPAAVDFVLDIRRDYARKLEESKERARKLRSDLAVEEHQGQEINRILKEILSDPKPTPPQRSRAVRKRSNERKRMSKCLTEEAMLYFDECVSISTFDSSDFSAPEDPSHSSVKAATSITAPALLGSPNIMSKSFPTIAGHIQRMDSHEDLSLTASSSHDEPLLNQVKQAGSDPLMGQKFQFSFGHKSREDGQSHDDLRSYIKHFEKDANKDVFNSDSTRSFYDASEFELQGHTESLLFGRVIFRNRIDSGGLHLCNGGFPITSFPFGFA